MLHPFFTKLILLEFLLVFIDTRISYSNYVMIIELNLENF